MFFAILVLLSAFLIEGIGTYVSVVGLSSLFAANPVIIVLAIALDVGKVVSVSFLYKYWKKVNLLMKTYMTIAAIVLMGITSAGAFGYLSAQFQKAIANTNESGVMISALTDEQARLQKRKEEIDAQIAKLPDNMVKGRKDLIKQFGPEVERINTRLVDIDKKLPELKVATLHQNVEVGPIIYIAEAFGTTPEHAVKWVILIIIFVFDPLAIALLLAGNFLVDRKEEDVKIEVPHLVTETGGEKVDIPEQNVESTTISSAYPSVNPGPYFIPSPTQAITSWTTSTSYEEPASEEPVVLEKPSLPPAMSEIVEEPVIPPEEIEAAIAAADLPPLDIPEVEKEPDAAVILGEDHPDIVQAETIASEIEDTLKEQADREIIRMNSLIKPVVKAPPRSSLEDVVGKSDVFIDENQLRASTMKREAYNDSSIDVVSVGGPFKH